ncbi:uncharacterized protein L201_004439 [Kwoniella dendrophila CBS 6074]|uniref:Uncharacterized protein n=1 Tax=Kwoniella dendrophila CBS 6074 TaxID=1295534 RepID=A0AAX4JVQ0_9TREE
MTTVTATMDDLIASLGGSMHVNPDLKALQEYLAQNMVRPTLPMHASTNVAFRPIPPSRSTSSSRKPMSLPSSYHASYSENAMMNQAFPSPMSQNSFSTFQEDDLSGSLMMNITTPTLTSRPGGPLRRTSSYGFGTASSSLQIPQSHSHNQYQTPSSPQTTYSNFDSDAFAPLYEQQQYHQSQTNPDPWAKIRSQAPNAFSQYNAGQNHLVTGPSQSSPFNSFRPPQGFGLQHQQTRSPSPNTEDDDEMDEDSIDADMDEDDEEEDRVEKAIMNDQYEEDMWNRGRMKF